MATFIGLDDNPAYGPVLDDDAVIVRPRPMTG